MRTKVFSLLLGLAVLGVQGGAAQGTTGPVSVERSCGKPTRILAFHVETEWASKVYRRSDKAVVVVTVTRPAHEDPLEQHIPLPAPPVSFPVEGATVSTSLIPKKFVFPPIYGQGETDAQGKVRFAIELSRLRNTGGIDASTYAKIMTNEGGCPDIEEYGWRYDAPAFVVID